MAQITQNSAEPKAGETMSAYNTRLTGVENRLDTVEGTLITHGNKLDQIITAVTKNEASRGPGLGEMIRTGSSLATAGAILAALMIYIITSVMNGPLTTLSERQGVLKETVAHKSSRIDLMYEELIVTKERLRIVNERLASGEFLRGWQATVAYSKPGS